MWTSPLLAYFVSGTITSLPTFAYRSPRCKAVSIRAGSATAADGASLQGANRVGGYRACQGVADHWLHAAGRPGTPEEVTRASRLNTATLVMRPGVWYAPTSSGRVGSVAS